MCEKETFLSILPRYPILWQKGHSDFQSWQHKSGARKQSLQMKWACQIAGWKWTCYLRMLVRSLWRMPLPFADKRKNASRLLEAAASSDGTPRDVLFLHWWGEPTHVQNCPKAKTEQHQGSSNDPSWLRVCEVQSPARALSPLLVCTRPKKVSYGVLDYNYTHVFFFSGWFLFVQPIVEVKLTFHHLFQRVNRFRVEILQHYKRFWIMPNYCWFWQALDVQRSQESRITDPL